MMAPLLCGAGAVLAVLASFAFYLGGRNQRLLRRPLPGRIAIAAGLAGTALAIAALACVVSLAVSIYCVVLTLMMTLSALPFLKLVLPLQERSR
ncbi:hypothetical protein [Maricaulis salignorans]|uniref:Uncharacterized protein n=1 Tax=Maricaulis salignorans TaxID=144026 RepID=A0A1G9TWF2_9PROT|nr:hypothetical protein [Maricaulis salignorans]SDM52100.1 hypothetical protein SAMN04488568_11336 [Maricaulis salignorans]